MSKLFYKPENAWVGDLIPYYEDGIYYGFYLHDPRCKEDEYAEETTWHLVTTKDFVNLDYHGEAIKRGADDKPNKNVYTGSIIKDKDGMYYAYYTAYNADFKINGKNVQSVMRAKGKDIYHLENDEDFLLISDDVIYEAFDWRDPYVFWNEEDKHYWMLLAARTKNSGALRGGCIALCKSEDLLVWNYEKPIFEPNMYVTMECPEVFQMDDWWYLVFSTFNDLFVTHYRMSKSPNGPWIIPEDDVFDTRANYAIKTASDGKQRFTFGWIPSKKGDVDFGPWEWGGTMVFHEIVQAEKTGILTVKPTEGLKKYYNKKEDINESYTYHCTVKKEKESYQLETQMLGAILFPIPKDSFSLEMDIHIGQVHKFGIAVHVDKDMEKGYFLKMDQTKNLVAWDMWPRSEQGFYQWQIKGDIAYQVETVRRLPKGNMYHVLMVREDDICVVYINDEVVLSTRMYDHKGECAGVYLVQGKATIDNLVIKTKA
jgi:beta-fructofuranosidase